MQRGGVGAPPAAAPAASSRPPFRPRRSLAPPSLHRHAPSPTGAGTALAGILSVLVAGGLDMKGTLGGKQHYLLYCLAPAMKPRMLMTGARSISVLFTSRCGACWFPGLRARPHCTARAAACTLLAFACVRCTCAKACCLLRLLRLRPGR